MNKKTNGSPEEASRQKDIAQKPFQDVLASFEALIKVEDPVRHEFELIKAARSRCASSVQLLQDVPRLEKATGGRI